MSRFLSKEAARLAPYTPGEQPQNRRYIKLNTNESPFPPSPKVIEALSAAEAGRLNLYSDPTCAGLTAAPFTRTLLTAFIRRRRRFLAWRPGSSPCGRILH